jgi:hypothetical protein
LQKLKLDAAMIAALTHASAKLVVEMDAGGTRVLLADQRTGQMIGGPDDLQKLGSIRAFVNRERKEALGIEAAKDVTQLAFLSEKLVKDTVDGFVMKPVDNSYGAAVRPLHAALLQAQENEKRVDENTSTANRDVYVQEIRRLFRSIGVAYADTICALTEGRSIKGLLKQRLFDEGVPEWVHSRFVSKTFTLERTGDLERIFFPSDPTKGLALTVKEWRSNDFVVKQGHLVLASVLIHELITDDGLLRALCGITDTISLDDEENPLIAKLLSSKATAMPVVNSADRVRELGGKTRSGFKFPNPSMDTVTGAIVALSTAVLRVYSANLQSVDLVGDYYATIVPGAVRREDLSPTNNFYVQWGKAQAKDRVWLQALRGGDGDLNLRVKLWRWLRTELRLSETARGGKALASALSLGEDGGVPTAGNTNGVIDDGDPEDLLLELPDLSSRSDAELVKPDRGLNLLRGLKDTEIPFWMQFQERVFPPKVGKKKQPVGVALTPLSQQGRVLLNRVKPISPYVAERMLSWLRSFSDERLQLAAIKVTNAEFDDIFSSQLEGEEDTQSELDWAEQEA